MKSIDEHNKISQNDDYPHSECIKSKLEKDNYDHLTCIFEKNMISSTKALTLKILLHLGENSIVCDLEQNILDGRK